MGIYPLSKTLLSDDGKTIVTGGTAPMLIGPIAGSFAIKTSKAVKVYALSSSGERLREIPVEKEADGYVSFGITKK